MTQLNSIGTALEYSTYLGGTGNDQASSLGVDASGNTYLTGFTGSANFPTTPGVIQASHGGEVDVFITKLELPPVSTLARNDFDGDGDSDLLLVHENGTIVTVLIHNSVYQSHGFVLQADPAQGWTVNSTGDVNGDKKSDILLYNTTTGEYRIITVNGTTVLTDTIPFVLDPAIGVQPRGMSDFDGDGKAEIILYVPASGVIGLAYLNGGAFDHIDVATTVDEANNWTLKNFADFTGDAKTDFLITNMVSGESAIIEMEGSIPINITPTFILDAVTLPSVDTADFTGDGKTDILALQSGTGFLAVLEMDGTTFQSLYVPGGLLPNWQLVNAGRYDGDNKADFLFFDPTTGEVITGIQDGTAITTYNTVLNLGPASGWTFPH